MSRWPARLDQLARQPRTLFLVDSLGALLSAFGLVAILLPFEPLFGMPGHILVMLAGCAGLLAVYSAGCFFVAGPNWRARLRVVCRANLLYVGVTAGLLIAFYDQLTPLGISYFVAEMTLISVLIAVERRAIGRR